MWWREKKIQGKGKMEEEGRQKWVGGGWVGNGIKYVIYNIPITSVTVASEATRMHLVATF